MFKVNPEEQEYAFLKKPKVARETSVHGTAIDLGIDLGKGSSELTGTSLSINGDGSVPENPDRYKQHGFHLTADNCIGCHACEVACSEKNDLPPHLAFRKVGIIEGGSYPNYARLNISMACNHCEDPVCLKGCPTRAYTKFAEYGAVLQDPDICFGCGYCTWVCPYNAPYLDPVKGQVSKCNMCVDRLEAGLKPACVSACLGNALDFGVIEEVPEGRSEAKLDIPALPDTSISRPNIRFELKSPLADTMRRVDKAGVEYTAGGDGSYRPSAVKTGKKGAGWNLKKLSSRENPLVLFTLLSQMAAGGFVALFLLSTLFGGAVLGPVVETVTLLMLLGAQATGLLLSTAHLGKPMRFYRGFNNLRYSWVSREALCVSIFFGLVVAYWAASSIDAFLPAAARIPAIALFVSLKGLYGFGGTLAAVASVYAMFRAYRIKTRPFWDHPATLGAFASSALILGPALIGAVAIAVSLIGYGAPGGTAGAELLVKALTIPLLAGLLIQYVSVASHMRYLRRSGGEGEAAMNFMTRNFAAVLKARSVALFIMTAFAVTLPAFASSDGALVAAWVLLLMLATLSELVGRAIFYVAVIPTTMPGAFFWRNAAFEEHAREVGLAKVVQAGIVTEGH